MRFRVSGFRWAAASLLAFVTISCSGELTEEKARLAAERAQAGLQPLDAGAMEQDLDSETVTRVQEQLTTLKEYMGPITGKLDPVTLNALEAFQRTANIAPDGRFNEETLQALDAAAKAQG